MGPVTLGRKDDGGKPRFSLFPHRALWSIIHVLEWGAKRYGDWNWVHVTPKARYWDAVQRHIEARRSGEMFDSESGLPHLAHACASLVFLLATDLGDTSPESDP